MMKKRGDFQVYIKYLNEYYLENQVAFLKFRQDKNLSRAEKSLLNTRILLREKKHDECLEVLESLKNTPEQFLQAERYLQFAALYLVKGEFEESIKFGTLAVRYYEETEDSIGLFKAFYNMSVACNRMSLNSLSYYFLTQCEKHTDTQEDKSAIARQKASLLSLDCKFDEAIEILESFANLEASSNEFELDANLIVLCENYIKNHDYEKAMEIAERMINSKVNLVKARIVFYFNGLKLLMKDEKLTEVPEVVSLVEEYRLKWEILEAIQMGEQELYNSLWNELRLKFPNYFGALGECIDESEKEDIFMQCLNNLTSSSNVVSIDLSGLRGKKGKVLVETLLNSDIPLRKEILIEKVWEEPYDPKFNSRFYKLVERVKQSTGLDIKNNNNAYFIEQEKKLSA